MAEHSLGKVTNASTTVGVRATNNLAVPAAQYPCNGYSIQALSTNTGSVYICDTPNPNLSTGVGVLWEVSSTVPMVSIDNATAPQGFNLANVYVLPAVSGEGVRVTAVK